MFVCITLPPPGSIRGAGQEESTLLNRACLKDADRVLSTEREASPEGLNQAKWVQDTDVTRTKPAQQRGAVSCFPSACIRIPAEALNGQVCLPSQACVCKIRVFSPSRAKHKQFFDRIKGPRVSLVPQEQRATLFSQGRGGGTQLATAAQTVSQCLG